MQISTDTQKTIMVNAFRLKENSKSLSPVLSGKYKRIGMKRLPGFRRHQKLRSH